MLFNFELAETFILSLCQSTDLSQDVMLPSSLKTFGENSIDNLKEKDSFQSEINDLQGNFFDIFFNILLLNVLH